MSRADFRVRIAEEPEGWQWTIRAFFSVNGVFAEERV
jgi:hypothetical protein